MPGPLTPRLCPRVLSKLTLDGAACDGIGILQRLEDEIRARAHKIWLETGNTDARANWKAAEKDILVFVHEAMEKLACDLGSNAGTKCPAAIKNEIDGPTVPLQEELLKTREAEMTKLQEELACLKQHQDEAVALRQKTGDRVKELQCDLEARSTSLTKMAEAYTGQLNGKCEKEHAVRRALEESEQKEKFLSRELRETGEGINEANLQMQRLADENEVQRIEVASLKQRLKELCEQAEKNNELALTDVNSKLYYAKALLSEKEKARVHEILRRNLVELDYEKDIVKMKEVIQFRSIKHQTAPNAVFTNKEKARAILEDAARLLQIFNTAKVVIEGHTATPDKLLDSWWYTIALSRAQAVMHHIEAFGVDKSRLHAAGLPGNRGSGVHQVLIKVVEV